MANKYQQADQRQTQRRLIHLEEALKDQLAINSIPVVPTVQVESDWNAFVGVATILNKPDLKYYAPQLAVVTGSQTTAITATINMNAESGVYYHGKPSTVMTFNLNPGADTPKGYTQKIFILEACTDVSVTGTGTLIGLPALTNANLAANTLLEYVYDKTNARWIRIQ